MPNMTRKMKDSGVEWIGEIPEGWELVRLSSVFSERKEKVSDRDFEPLSVTKQGILPQIEGVAKTDNGDSRKRVSKGDFVINSRSDRKGSSGVSSYDGSVSLINIVLRPTSKVKGGYVHHLLRSYAFQEEFYRWGHGIVADLWTTNSNDAKGILLPLPEAEEQQRIADFLDTQTADIDASIAKTQESIEEYKKLKQAVITQAVTKGIRPGRAMKDSGVEWIGEIPEEWRMAKVSHFFSITRGRVIPIDSLSPDAPYPVFSSQTQNSGCMGFLHSYDIEGESLTWTTDGANAGTVFYRTGKYNCTNVCGVLQPLSILKSEVILKFISYSLGYSAHICRRADINGYKIMSNEMAGIKFTLPPLAEQQEIAAYLDEKCAAIDTLIEKKQAIITELEAYKKSLIYEYVTGKKEVPMASC